MFSSHHLSLSHAAAAPSIADILQLLPPRDMATNPDWMLWTSTCGMCFGSESKARRGLWLLKHANKAEKKMGLRTGLPSIYKSRLHSQLCLLEDLLHVACLRTMLTHDMSSHHHHKIKMSQFKSIYYYINLWISCLSNPGFHHLLEAARSQTLLGHPPSQPLE